MIEDRQLMGQYAATGSEAAFAELVRRHLKMVYGVALRQVNGDTHLSEDVAQSVFADLARKAGQLQHNGSVAGWLYRSTCFAAANAVRAEARRRTREQMVVSMTEMNADANSDWNELRPMIDAALSELDEADREALVLRFLEANELSLVGTALGVSENAARMRVARALEKLRGVLQKQGIATSDAALSGALMISPAIAAPGQLAAHITSAAMTQAATTTASGATSLMRILIMKKITLAAVAVLAVSLATMEIVKTQRTGTGGETGIRKFEAEAKVASVRPGQTLILGGWLAHEGGRMLVFVTPIEFDPTGKELTDPPFGEQTQIRIETKFVSASETVLRKLGLQTLFTEQNSSKEVVQCSYNKSRDYVNSIMQSAGGELLSSPSVMARPGQRASMKVGQEEPTSAGKNEFLGYSLDLLASISADSASLDLEVTAAYSEAAAR